MGNFQPKSSFFFSNLQSGNTDRDLSEISIISIIVAQKGQPDLGGGGGVMSNLATRTLTLVLSILH